MTNRHLRLGLILLLYGMIVFGGSLLGDWIGKDFDPASLQHTDPAIHRALIAAFIAYILLTALPFVPGVEIGMAIILLFGVPIVPLVYLASITSLSLSFIAGRMIPERYLMAFFRFLGMRQAEALVARLQPLDQQQRLQYLVAQAPSRWAQRLLRYRHIALMVLINLPGSALIGGGGGICMAAGMSRLFTLPGFLLLVAVAVSPVPISILLGSRLGVGLPG